MKISNKIDFIRGSSLTAKSSRGILALAMGTVFERVFRIFRYMILTRLLAPSELGLMAIILAATYFFEAVAEVGIKASIIQNKKGAQKEYLNVAWWFQVSRGVALFAIAFYLAPLASRFYKQPELDVLFRIAFLAILFRGFVSPKAHLLEKEFRFYRSVFLIHGSAVAGTVVTLVLAFLYRNVWAMVIGYVSENFLLFFFSFVFCPFRPYLQICRECLQDLLHYAKGVLGLPILTMIAFQGDVLVAGKVLSMDLVGLYSMAWQLAQMPRDFFMRIFGPVLLAAFSVKQDEPDTLRAAVVQITRATAILFIPIIAFLILFSGRILSAVWGPEYGTVAVPFGILTLCILLRTQGVPLGTVYFAMGDPHLHRNFAAIRAGILICILYPAVVYYGLIGASFSVLISEITAMIFQVIWMKKRVGLSIREYLIAWVPGMVSGCLVILTSVFIQQIPFTHPLFSVAISGVFCIFFLGIGMVCFVLPGKGGFVKESREESASKL